MKYLQNNIHTIQISLLLILIISFSSCYEYPELSDFQYEDYRRVIGPDGGSINFYENYADDSIKNVLVEMNFPINALDSFVVFNMYEFYDEFIGNDLENIDMFINTQFLYFLPFYESDGYNPQEDFEYHLSLDFNVPVNVTYNLNRYLTIDNTLTVQSIFLGDSKLYRIKIPKLDEWARNMWVDWNIQGYPDGYYSIDLKYLISGRWTELSEWGYGDLSLTNWEEIAYTYDNFTKTITFDIESTDYIYVIGEYYGAK